MHATPSSHGGCPETQPAFEWHHYRNSVDAVDFWPASTIKVYTVIAALEYLNELKMNLDSVIIFERKTEGRWVLDAARTMRDKLTLLRNGGQARTSWSAPPSDTGL